MICTVMETSKLTAEGIIGEAVRIGVKMSGGEFPIEVFPIRIQRIISSLHDCQGYPVDYVAAAILAAIAVGIGNSHLVQVKSRFSYFQRTKNHEYFTIIQCIKATIQQSCTFYDIIALNCREQRLPLN